MTTATTTMYTIKDRFDQDMPIIVPPEKLEKQDLRRIQLCASLYPAALTLSGLQRSGKSMFLAYLAFCFKYYFNINTIADFNFKPPEKGGNKILYDSYEYMDDEDFVKMLGGIKQAYDAAKKSDKLSRKQRMQMVREVVEKSGINLSKKFAAFDEVHKKMEKRRPHDPISLLYEYVILEYAHYYSTIAMSGTDNQRLADFRATSYCTHDIICKWEKSKYFVKNGRRLRVTVNRAYYYIFDRMEQVYYPPFYLDGPEWWNLFDSFQLLAPRGRHIEKLLKQYEKEEAGE